jgi:arylsulfatase A-like enzyme
MPSKPLYQSIVKGEYKLIRNFIDNKPPYELYDTNSDPKELSNLASENSDIVRNLYKDLKTQLNDSQYIYEPNSVNLILGEERKESLRSLGY